MNRYLTMAGLAVVLAAAAVLSFAALRDLAIAVRVSVQLAFLLPIAVDAGAAVSCAVWLSPSARPDARRFACWLTWALLGATVVGNAAQLGMHANAVVPPWWVAVLVGAVPPAVVGGVVHLLVLVGRGAGAKGSPRVRLGEPTALQIDGLEKRGKPVTEPGDDLEDRARQLVATGAGRGTLARELNLTEYEARTLVEKVRSNGQVTR